jgi:rSAM/selenodomain-associated transferase 2
LFRLFQKNPTVETLRVAFPVLAWPRYEAVDALPPGDRANIIGVMDLSIIIPTFDEETCLPHALASLPTGAEVIISDGQSRDRTTQIAEEHRARVVMGPRGRGAQMNRGAKAAAGDILLFLHADCELGPGALEAVRAVLESPDVAGGSFRLRISGPSWSYRLVAFGSNLRARSGLPYGDQAIFVRRSVFDAIGGYPEIPIMEDVEFVRRIRRRGRLVAVAETVTTGTRHWDALGPLLTTLLNWITVSLYFCGVEPSRLYPIYHRLREQRAIEPALTRLPVNSKQRPVE